MSVVDTNSSVSLDESPKLPGILRLPYELRSRILLDVLSAGVWSCAPAYAAPLNGFPLYKHDMSRAKVGPSSADISGFESIRGLLFSCRTLHHECLNLLAEQFAFIIRMDVCDVAPTGANAFREVHALDPVFRNRIRKIMLLVSFLPPQGILDFDKFLSVMDPAKTPLMFEKIIENVNEILHLMPGVKQAHLVWNMFFGSGGLAMMKERYTKQLWERLRDEWWFREVEWSAQTCMSRFKEEKTERTRLVYTRRIHGHYP